MMTLSARKQQSMDDMNRQEDVEGGLGDHKESLMALGKVQVRHLCS